MLNTKEVLENGFWYRKGDHEKEGTGVIVMYNWSRREDCIKGTGGSFINVFIVSVQ